MGIPKNEQTPRNDDEAVSAALLLKGSSSVMSQPTFFIIREPPISVPSVIADAHARAIPNGILKLEVSDIEEPSIKVSPKRYTPMNFCESCAP